MKKPVYLFVVPFFPSTSCHGGSYIYDQVKAIQQTGRYRVFVIMGTRNLSLYGDYEYNSIKVYRFKERSLPSALYPGIFDKLNIKNFIRCLKRISIDINDIAVVHSHMIRQGVYANHIKSLNPNVLSILQYHGYDVLAEGDGIFAKYDWHKRIVINYGVSVCNRIDLHVGVSKATLSQLQKFENLKIKYSYVLYNGVDTKSFYPKQKESNSYFTIGCVANFWEIKDQITLIKATEILIKEKHIENIRVNFVGTGATLESCKEYVREHGLHPYISFLPVMPHEKLIDFYNTLDLFVLPSYWDTLGCVYLEAYACGVPFMSAEGTGIKELIPNNDRDKWIARKSDFRNLATLIKNYIDKHPKQTLLKSIDIKDLIGEFLDLIKKESR